MAKIKFRQRLLKYLGFPFGIMFPIVAYVVDILVKDLPFTFRSIIHLHSINPLHWIIDTAPLILGFSFYFVIQRLNDIVDNFKQTAEVRKENERKLLLFIEDINRGDFSSEIEANEEADDEEFVEALLKLREKLSTERDNEKIRNWTNEGLAKFSDVLRSGQEMQLMYDNLISNIVEYVNANQGGIYIIDENENEETVIKLVSCYAYSRKKFEEKEIMVGQGLLGQTYLEGQTLVLKSIPKEYVSITSGMGEATPNHLLIIPLKVNETVEALLEVASFQEFGKHHVQFLEKLGEGIASTVSTIKVDQKTKMLLEQSQVQTEEMRAQEEEMRQNMEELQATQEEMARKETEYLDRINKLEKINADE